MSTRRSYTGSHVTTLSDFGGLDLSHGSGDSTPRFSRLDNMWRDYHAGDGNAIESFPGFRILTQGEGCIWNIWEWKTSSCHFLLVHAGNSLYYCEYSETDATVLPSGLHSVIGSYACLQNKRSVGFADGDTFYILDGANYFFMRPVGNGIHFQHARNLYIPVTYSDDLPYEQRNLLSRYTVHRFHVTDANTYPCETAGLRFRITDYENRLCEVIGYAGEYRPPVLYVPAETIIGGLPHRVTAVGYKAFFGMSHLREVFLPEGMEEVKEMAFFLCANLERVFLPDSLLRIGKRAFGSCPTLALLSLGELLSEVDETVADVNENLRLLYHGDEDDFALISIHESNTALLSAPRSYLAYPAAKTYCFPLREEVDEIEEVTLDGMDVKDVNGSAVSYSTEMDENNRIKSVIFFVAGIESLIDKEVRIKVSLSDTAHGGVSDKIDYAMSNQYDGTAYAAMAECTMVALYDGRVFFSGNPALPNTVFYTARDDTGAVNPAYVGGYNYFHVGNDSSPVTALLSTGNHLAVFTGTTVGGGEVHYYSGEDTGDGFIPRIYAREEVVRGGCCRGMATMFRDDPVYLSDDGVEAISRAALHTERSLKHRSTLIDAALCSRSDDPPLFAVWDGYLVLLMRNGEAYLADSRCTASTTRGTEYEWYHLTDMYAYNNDLPVLRYADGYYSEFPDVVIYQGLPTPLSLHPDADALPHGCTLDTYADVYPRILSGTATDGQEVFFTVEGDYTNPRLYLLRRTEERTGGTPAAPTALAVVGDKLFFGCENGAVAVINTDRRGIMNPSQAHVYDPEAYQRQWGHLINPEWYSHGGHRALTGLATLPDDNGVPNYTKGTLRGTTVLEMKGGVGLGFSIEVRLFRPSGIEAKEILHVEEGGLDFTSLNFGSINFGANEDCSVVLNERSRRYLKKQYCVFSDAFARPFGLYSISYTWKTEGKVKNA